jgi:spore maturation protein B
MTTWTNTIADCMILALVVGIPLWGYIKGVPVYDAFIQGAREGIPTTIRIIPFLVGMIVGIGMLRASGAFDLLANAIGPWLHHIGIPESVLPLALVRPFSGSAANAVLVDIIHHHGANSLDAHMAATMVGSSETTFYLIAIYFGCVGIKKTRYAVWVGLLGDITGSLAAISICHFLLG